MSSAGKKLLSAIVFSKDMKMLASGGLSPEMLKESELALYSFIKGHVGSYGVIPSPDTIEDHLGDVLLSPGECSEPGEFYLSELEKRFLQSRLKSLVFQVTEELNAQNPDKAYESLINLVSDLHLQKSKNSLMDFREVADIIHAEYVKQQMGDDSLATMFGWPTMDAMTGGLRAGDFCSLLGRPASGKTFMGLYTARHNWTKGGTPLFISMEMNMVSISQRLAAMEASKPLTQLMKGMLTTKAYKQLLTVMEGLKKVERPFWLLDGNLVATGEDVIMFARQLKPSAIWVDGAYLLRHPNSKISRFERITENAELLKQRVATDLGMPVIASYQFKRKDSKKKDSKEKSTIDDVYGSDSIAQLSSVALGMFEDESVETMVRRKVSVLKGRNGEAGEFLINWDFKGMNYTEIATTKDASGNMVESTEELQFLG